MDFLVYRKHGEKDWKISALEINLRMGGTTHPYLALQFLTGGQLDLATGLFFSPSGHAKYYRATDNLKSDAYRGLLPEDLIEILTYNKLHYNHATESGVLFHLIGALSQFGKVGLTAIGNTPAQAEELYARTVSVLDSGAARASSADRSISSWAAWRAAAHSSSDTPDAVRWARSRPIGSRCRACSTSPSGR